MKLKVKPNKKVTEKKEMYGLDFDFLEDLGLGDMLSDSDEPEQSKPEENMTYEDLREQFDIDGKHKAVNKLRGAC